MHSGVKRHALQPADRSPRRSLDDMDSSLPASGTRRGLGSKTRGLAAGDPPGGNVTGRSLRSHFKQVRAEWTCIATRAVSGPNGRAEWTCIATRAVSRCACREQVPNPFVAKCFGFPSSAWARQIYLLSERTLERASDGAPGPAIGAADCTGQRVGDRPGAAVHVFSSWCPPDDRAKPIIDDDCATSLGSQLDFAALASPLSV
jgi:hypothetical protein